MTATFLLYYRVDFLGIYSRSDCYVFLLYDGIRFRKYSLTLSDALHMGVYGCGRITYLIFVGCVPGSSPNAGRRPITVIRVPTCIFLDLITSSFFSTTEKLFRMLKTLPCTTSVSLDLKATLSDLHLITAVGSRTPMLTIVDFKDSAEYLMGTRDAVQCLLLDFDHQCAFPIKDVMHALSDTGNVDYKGTRPHEHDPNRRVLFIPTRFYNYLDLSEWV